MAVHKVHKLPVVPPLCGSGAWSKGTFGPWRGLGNHRNVTGMWILFFWGFYALSSMFISNPLTWSFITFICIYHFLVISSFHHVSCHSLLSLPMKCWTCRATSFTSTFDKLYCFDSTASLRFAKKLRVSDLESQNFLCQNHTQNIWKPLRKPCMWYVKNIWTCYQLSIHLGWVIFDVSYTRGCNVLLGFQRRLGREQISEPLLSIWEVVSQYTINNKQLAWLQLLQLIHWFCRHMPF